jgi:hypothetical protein
MAVATLFMPQWLFGVTTGEAAAIYCLFSVPITISFMPYFKRFFQTRSSEFSDSDGLKTAYQS